MIRVDSVLRSEGQADMLSRKVRRSSKKPLSVSLKAGSAAEKKRGTASKRKAGYAASLQRMIAHALKTEGLNEINDVRQLARAAGAANVKLARGRWLPGNARRNRKQETVPVMDAAVKPYSVAAADIDKAIRFTQQVFSR